MATSSTHDASGTVPAAGTGHVSASSVITAGGVR